MTRRVLWSINKPLGLAFNVFNELVILKGVIHQKEEIHMRSFSHNGLLF